jgi:hypothetical protein
VRKIFRVVELDRHLELALERVAHLRMRAVGIAALVARLSECHQRVLRRRIAGAVLVRVLGLHQLGEREVAAIEQAQRPVDRLGGAVKQPRHFGRSFQVPLGIGFEQPPGRVDGDALANAGHDVLQGPPLRRMIQHVVHGDQRHRCAFGDRGEPLQAAGIVAAIQHAGGEPDGVPNAQGLQPRENLAQRVGPDPRGRHHDEIEARAMFEQVVEEQDALGLLAAALADGEQAREMAPRPAVLRIGEDIRRAVGEGEPRADRELQRRQVDALGVLLVTDVLVPFFQRVVGAHDPRHAVAVRDPDSGEAESQGLEDEFLRMRCAAEEREVGRHRKLGVAVRRLPGRRSVTRTKLDDIVHANTPCRYQRTGSSRSCGHARKTHTRKPSRLST